MAKLGIRGRGALILLALTVAAASPGRPASDVESARFPAKMLDLHNSVRAKAGVGPLEWDNSLGRAAANYALQLALTDIFAHSDQNRRAGAGENLWMGSRGAFSLDSMIAAWTNERSLFRPGKFPDVSRTGNWRDVAHYTQVIWPTTRRFGCALSRNSHNEFLVCRYYPSGNVNGYFVLPRAASTRLSR